MSPEEYITNLVLNLGEVENLELLQVLNSLGDRPPFAKGEFSPVEVEEWVRRNAEYTVSSLLRVVDLSNDAVAYLYRLGVLPLTNEETVQGTDLQIIFSDLGDAFEYPNSPDVHALLITDLAA